jgi:hypothetical protein
MVFPNGFLSCLRRDDEAKHPRSERTNTVAKKTHEVKLMATAQSKTRSLRPGYWYKMATRRMGDEHGKTRNTIPPGVARAVATLTK